MAENFWKTFNFGDFSSPFAKPAGNTKPVFGHHSYNHVYKPYNPFDTDWINEYFKKGTLDLYTYTLTWKNDVAEVEIDLPGVKKTGLTVTFEPEHLSISSVRKDITSIRKVQVDTAALDHEKCEATLEDGVLLLKLVRKTPVRKTLIVK